MEKNLKNTLLSVSCGIALMFAMPVAAQIGTRSPHPSPSQNPRLQGTSKRPALLSTSYAFTFLDFPQAPDTVLLGVNSGATASATRVVGAYGATVPLQEGGSGFLLTSTGGKGSFTQAFRTNNFPKEPLQQLATGVNDSAQVVGNYGDSLGVLHGYELTGKTFTAIDVPFTGAVNTASYGLNDSSEIVGLWDDTSGTTHGFTVIGGVYTSFDYPGATYTVGYHVNTNGDIVGAWTDSAGTFHGFLLSGGTFTSIDVPGAVYTQATGINDSGTIVGFYCTTTQCVSDQNSAQGFVLSGGVYTTVNVPAVSSTLIWDINNKGMLVGSYSDCGGGAGLAHGFMATP